MVAVTLFVASFIRITSVDLGFRASGLLAFEARPEVGEPLEQALLAVPDVRTVARQAGGTAALMTETFGGRSGLFTLLPDADPTATGIEVALRRVNLERPLGASSPG